ncbi:MAG: sigma-70 family RNA polymerase sigma factor [Roseomonas sp.]|nr:sigma-70 family RNA polymerase sigma factor [Roseomonas sp.]
MADVRGGDVEDRQLLLASGRGDRKAFARLVSRHRGLVARVAGRYGLGPHDVDDVAQEVFARAWDAAPNWPADGAPFAAWLYRVASNLAIDLLRREKRRPVTSLEAASMIVDMAPAPSAAVLQVELASAVRAALLELPERQRLAVELVHLESRSGAETAALLGTSIGALEGLLSRARRELRILLARRGLAAAKDWDEGLS